jgi:lipoprotein-releasing system permease protein
MLRRLPEGVPVDAQTGRVGPAGDPLFDRLRYDREERALSLRGTVTEEERQKIVDLAPDDKDWAEAVAKLARESRWPGMIPGAGLLEVRKGADGKVHGIADWKYKLWAKLTVLGVGPDGRIDERNKAESPYRIVDHSRTQMWQYDQKTVYVPFHVLQADLGMGPTEATSRADPDKKIAVPARTSEIHIRLKDGANLMAAKRKIQDAVLRVWDAAYEEGLESGALDFSSNPPRVETWEEVSAVWLGAIKKEKLLVVFLFGIISVVAVFLIFCIFYMIVAEKTKDIGIIKSVGATGGGVAGIFLGYGLAIGIVGTSLGLLLSFLIVRNINEIHDWLGHRMGVTIWNPEVYAFETIPNTMNPNEVVVIIAVGILASVLGALVPAVRAARMHPVEALRWE